MSDPFSDSGTGASRMRVDSADYELLWPRVLLIRELTALRGIRISERVPMVERLRKVRPYRSTRQHRPVP